MARLRRQSTGGQAVRTGQSRQKCGSWRINGLRKVKRKSISIACRLQPMGMTSVAVSSRWMQNLEWEKRKTPA